MVGKVSERVLLREGMYFQSLGVAVSTLTTNRPSQASREPTME
jgi:hypothetical protein